MVEETLPEVLVEPLLVDGPRERGILEDRLDLRRKHETPVPLRVEERLDAEVIARENEFRLVAGIEDREPPHPVETTEAADAPLGVGVQRDLGVAAGAELVPERFELGAQLAVVVDLAVVDDDDAVIGRHRLCAAGEVDDAEAAEPEAHVR